MSMRSTSRRAAALIAGAAIASTMMAQSAAAVPPPEATTTAKPAINMERLRVAAQLDQYRPNNGKTRGAVKSVRRIQRQLRRRGIRVAVDGNFGAQTMNGYARWQRRLGYSGLDASGMPGETSLKRLAGTTICPSAARRTTVVAVIAVTVPCTSPKRTICPGSNVCRR